MFHPGTGRLWHGIARLTPGQKSLEESMRQSMERGLRRLQVLTGFEITVIRRDGSKMRVSTQQGTVADQPAWFDLKVP